MKNLYTIVYNLGNNLDGIPFDSMAFHNFIDALYKNGSINDWWNYLDNVYIISVPDGMAVNDVYNVVFPGMPKRHMLVSKVDPLNMQGWLSNDAWGWIDKYK